MQKQQEGTAFSVKTVKAECCEVRGKCGVKAVENDLQGLNHI